MKKLVLFDIDGTILFSRGLGKRALISAIKEHVGEDFDDSIKMAGNTDTDILYMMLSDYLPEPQIKTALNPIFRSYVRHLTKNFTENNGVTLTKGVNELIKRLHNDEEVLLGLLTGNIEEGAKIKLAVHDLLKYFKLGSFGHEARYRKELPQIALDKAYKLFKKKFSGKDIVIIGDTVNDILCGRHLGVKTIIVYSSFSSKEEILAHKPDYFCYDFSDVDKIISVIKS